MGRDPHLPLAAVLPLLLLLLSSLAAAAAKSADEGAISDLAKSLSNLPSSWTSGGDVCTFDGITCERGGEGRVTAIRLGNKGVSGTLPPSLSSLTALTELDLEGNTLGGAFPSVAGLTGLTRLVLNDNWFASLPKDFLQDLPSLQYLSLENMPKLEPWSVSDAIVGSSSLETFAASNASITGAFPAVLANLTSLRSLRLSYNKLTGGLPAGLAELIALDSLQLNNQQLDGKLSGPINVIAAMTNLKVLWIQSNQFTGPIPDLSKSQLESFNVRDNMLTGVVPASLTGIKTLKNVSLTNNQFQGPMPEFNKGVVVELSTETQSRFCQTKPGPCDPLVTILLEVAAGFGYPYELAKTWNGNAPCSSTWIGIVCSSGKDLIIVNLPKRNLSGTISPAFAKLTGLQKLDLSDNHLTGEIPEDLATMPNLNLFDVTNNNLSGELPTFKPSVKVLAEGNRFGESGFLPSSLAGAHKNVGMIIGILIAVVLLVACVVLLVRHLRRKNSEKFGPVSTKGSPDESEMMKIQVVGINGNNNEDSAVQTELYSQVSSGSTNIAHMFESHGMQFSMEVLLKATNNFNEDCILGKGGFGVVYKGNLDGKLVAVKRCDSGVMGTKGQQEFMAEIDVLRKVRHRHLVGLLGYCTHGYERLLVYEYMSGGTLREHLCDLQKSGYTPLTWTQRMTIALDVARGIEYLHGLAQETFIHRDLKPSNILLDQDLRAKVSDFGLVKLANDTDKSMQTRVAGTFGYLAPEYATTGKVTTKVDVYAYGVILMEMLAGRKALDDSLPEDETHLVTIFRKSMLDKEKFRKFVDTTMELSAEAWKSLLEVADLARHCTAREPNQRPDMSHCVNRLSSLLDEWKPTDIDDDDDDECETSQMGLNQQLEKWRCDDFTISDSDTFSMSRKYN